MSTTQRTYLPAAGRDLFLPLYDPFVKLLGGDQARRALLDQAAIRSGERVLDVGCGTGTFILVVKERHPDVEVVGLDPDPKALARAKRKAQRAGVSIQLDRGFSNELPYPEASFDHVFSSLMFHHLPADEKLPTLREVRRILKPGASFHLLDFGGDDSAEHGILARLIHSHERLSDNSAVRILALMKEAGFRDPQKTGERSMFFMRLEYYRASGA